MSTATKLVRRGEDNRLGRRVWLVTVDGRSVGLVGDTRLWRGSTWGGLRWWAALRDTEDLGVPALWNTGDTRLRTRRAALDALLAAAAERDVLRGGRG